MSMAREGPVCYTYAICAARLPGTAWAHNLEGIVPVSCKSGSSSAAWTASPRAELDPAQIPISRTLVARLASREKKSTIADCHINKAFDVRRI